MRSFAFASVFVAAAIAWSPAGAQIVTRSSAPAGTVIARKIGEEVRFVDISNWRNVDVKQDLLPGDVLRTNALGQLAVLFADRTQVRVGRNTVLQVKAIGAAADTVFSLQAGTIWARAERGGPGLTVETPAAAAAIRGTDWTMTVAADGKTSLIVLEGRVQLSNPQGSVSVGAGEAAVASIGKAPTKIIIVAPDDRAQMLFYLSLRNAFTTLPVTPSAGPAMRAAYRRISNLPEEHRSVEDWTTLAELALAQDGQEAAMAAVERARAKRPNRSQAARLDLVEGMVLAARKKPGDAAILLRRAAPGLDPERRATASYAAYFARALADPEHVEKPPVPNGGGPSEAIAQAWTVGFLEGIKPAAAVIAKAEKRYPKSAVLPAMRAKLALLIDDRAQAEEAIARALALDPENADAIEARGDYLALFKGERKAGLADLQRAAALRPGSSDVWNMIGLVQSDRGDDRAAEAAFRKAIALDPQDPVAHANLAILYLDQDRLKLAKSEIDTAIALDPEFHVGLVARGRYYLQTGEREKALQDILAGSTADPAYAQALLMLGAAHYESGDRDAADQAMDNAERLDPNDPVIASFRTAVAIDDYDADAAIDSARQTLARSRAQGGDYAPLSANQDAGSTLNEAFRLQGLHAWGRYYGDAVFSPFSGASFVDQAVSGSANPFADAFTPGLNPLDPGLNANGFSSFFQGLLLSPEMLAGRSRSANLVRRPFIEGSVGAGIYDAARNPQPTGEAEIQAFSATPLPVSLYATVKSERATDFRQTSDPAGPVPYVGFDLDHEELSGTAYLTARPTPEDRFVSYFAYDRATDRLANAQIALLPDFPPLTGFTYDRSVESRSWTAGIGWSHTLDYHDTVNAALFASGVDQSSDEAGTFLILGFPVGLQNVGISSSQKTLVGAVSHTVETGPVTWRYGLEGGKLDYSRTVDDSTAGATAVSLGLPLARTYVDAIYEISPDLKAEAGLSGTYLGDVVDVTRLEPHGGVAWSFAEGQWLRAIFSRDTQAINAPTLGPVGVLGLQPNQIPLDIGGYADTVGLRWDAEWTDRLFTSVDYQHQQLSDLSLIIPGGLTTIDLSDGRIDRVSATANLRLGSGFGAFATGALAASRNTDPASIGFGRPLPFVPERAATFGLTWVNPANIKITVAETYVGVRAGDESGDGLEDYWTTDAFLTWEPFDKRFSLELAGYNLTNEAFSVAASTPGWGRTFMGTFKARF